MVKLDNEMLQANIPCGLQWPSFTTRCTEPYLQSWAQYRRIYQTLAGKPGLPLWKILPLWAIVGLRKESP